MSIVRDTYRHILVSAFSLVMGLIYQISLARLVGVEKLAGVQSIFALQVIMSTIFLSFNMALTQIVIQSPDDAALKSFLKWLQKIDRANGLFTVLVIVVHLGLHFLLPRGLALSESAATLLFFIGSFLFTSFQAITAGLQRFKQLSQQVFYFHLCRLGALLLLGLLIADATVVMTSAALSIFAVNLYCRFCIRDLFLPSLPPPEVKGSAAGFFKQIMTEKSLLAGNVALALFANADVILMQLAASPVEAGTYSATVPFSRALYLLLAAGGSIVFPFLFKQRHTNTETIRPLLVLFAGILLISFILGLLYAAIPTAYYQMVLGPGYTDIHQYIAASTYMYAAIGCLSVLFSVQSAASDSRFAYALLVGACIALPLCLVLPLTPLGIIYLITGVGVALCGLGLGLHRWAPAIAYP